jgi:hypothetical protein
MIMSAINVSLSCNSDELDIGPLVKAIVPGSDDRFELRVCCAIAWAELKLFGLVAQLVRAHA